MFDCSAPENSSIRVSSYVPTRNGHLMSRITDGPFIAPGLMQCVYTGAEDPYSFLR
jgi:hypothetical protein